MTSQWPLEPDATEMRRLVEGALARLVPYVATLPAQPASEVAGGRRARPRPRRGDAGERHGLRGAPRPALRPGGGQGVQRRRPRLPRLHPRRRPLPLGRRRPARRRHQSLRRSLGSRPRPGAARGQRGALVLRPRRLSARGAWLPHQRRLARQLQRGGDGAPQLPARALPPRRPLRLRPGAPLGGQGGDARGFPGRERAGDPVRRALPPVARAARRRDRRGPPARARRRSCWSPAPARSTPERSTTSRRSAPSPAARGSGSTSTAPTAASSC